ncbi:MAG TPA: S8 family serine peptidase, partial [Candidatus Limnocylindrales bacterium]|nr:S8 family serine peptidase [Candidatus Limnocylindrales bacterium]
MIDRRRRPAAARLILGVLVVALAAPVATTAARPGPTTPGAAVTRPAAAPHPSTPMLARTMKLPAGATTAPVSRPPFRVKSKSRLDSVLQRIAAAAARSVKTGVAAANAARVRTSQNRVLVVVESAAANSAKVGAAIRAARGEVTGTGNGSTLTQAWVPVGALRRLAANAAVAQVRVPAAAVLTAGPIETEGDAAINLPAWQAAGRDGAGVKVGIIDGGFEGYPALLGTELPADVVVKTFVDGEVDGDVDGTTPHGTACAEIVHDVAPAASLYLAKIATNVDLEEAVTWLRAQHVKVISTSIGFYNLTAGDGMGYFENIVASARAAGILWVTAAGNDRLDHWGGSFRDANGNNFHEFSTGQEVDYFGPGDGSGYLIDAGYEIDAFVRWNDWAAHNQDYDLYILRYDEFSGYWDFVGFGEDLQTGAAGQHPVEFASAVTSGAPAVYGILIEKYKATRAVNLEVFVPGIPLDKAVHGRSLANLADANSAMTVGALNVTSPYVHETYSSEGPTNGPGGAATGGAVKPDISAYANVSTASFGAGVFDGTSSATPHVAGAAAVVKASHPTFTPAEIEAYLEARAVDMGTVGLDNVYGFGRLFLGAV